MNSLLNQQRLCRTFAEKHEHEIVGQSYDDNVSGMCFARRGLDKLTTAMASGKIDAVIVKDISRLGRHRTQTALFIDYLRERGVRVLSATEGLDTFREEDDVLIGVRGLMNDYYAKDIGKKVRTGYRQKQRDGLVIAPPFGYWKDKNNSRIKIVPEAAEAVRMIFSLYLRGVGLKEIARELNQKAFKTPAQLKCEQYEKNCPDLENQQRNGYLWGYTSVKNILCAECYAGTLINHRREAFVGKGSRAVPEEEQFRHEDVYPALIPKEIWYEAQRLLAERNRPRAYGNKAKHRYAGLLTCRECGSPFVAMNRYWNGNLRVEYICKTYLQHDKYACTSHRVHEEWIDRQVEILLSKKHERSAVELSKLMEAQKMWALRKPILDAHIFALQEKVKTLEQEIDAILMEKIQRK
jgi:Site-specific recombinases, DNA invertase Pin homologs